MSGEFASSQRDSGPGPLRGNAHHSDLTDPYSTSVAPSAILQLEGLLPPCEVSPHTTQSSTLIAQRPHAGGGKSLLYRETLTGGEHRDALFYLSEGPHVENNSAPLRRVYMAPIPRVGGDQWAEHIATLFSCYQPEHFENYFANSCSGRLIIDQNQESPPPQAQSEEAPAWDDFFATLGEPLQVLPRGNGAEIRTYRDSKAGDLVVTLSASSSPLSDCIAFRIKSSEHWINAMPIGELLRHLRVDQRQSLVNRLRYFIDHTVKDQRGVIFKGSIKTSKPLADLLKALPESLTDRVAASEMEDMHAVAFSQSILERETTLVVTHRSPPSRTNLTFNSLVLTLNNEGRGTCTLNVAHKAGGGQDPRTSLETVSRITYDIDTAGMSTPGRQKWLLDLLEGFADNKESLHGRLTTMISQFCEEHLPSGLTRMKESGRADHLESFRLHERDGVQLFVREIFARFPSPSPNLLSLTTEGAVVEASNSKGDRMRLTVRPSGIEKIVVFPRTTSAGEGQRGVAFSLAHHYQLGAHSRRILSHLALIFASENGALQTITDSKNAPLDSFGAKKTYDYLTNLTLGFSGPNHLIVLPESPDTLTRKGTRGLAPIGETSTT